LACSRLSATQFWTAEEKQLMNRSHSSEVSDKFCELNEDISANNKEIKLGKGNQLHSQHSKPS